MLAITIVTKLSMNLQRFIRYKDRKTEIGMIDMTFLVMLGELCVKIYIEDSQNIEARNINILKLFSLLRQFKLDRNPAI